MKSLNRINEAKDAGFYLEAITLLESVISDRIEARLQNLGLECQGNGNFWPLSKMADTLARQSHDPVDAQGAYKDVKRWAKRRNSALHGLGKLAKIEDKDWDQKYSDAQATADEGMTLFRRLDKEVKNLNRHRAS